MKQRRSLVALVAALTVATAGWIGFRYEGAGADMTRAAEQFLKSLSAEQRGKATMVFDNPARLDWHFIPKPERKGLQVKEMNDEQRKHAHALLHSGLSQIGYDKATAIMSLEIILHELEKTRKGSPIRDPERYYFTVFGAPSNQGRWGWSVEGHHLSLNFVVDRGRLAAATPAFFGDNPAVVKNDVSGAPGKGTRVLAKEESLAFDLLHSLSDEQRKAALIDEKPPGEIRGPATPQPPREALAGLKTAKLNDAQSKTLWGLLETYAEKMPAEVGAAWLGEIKKAGVGNVHFAWAGADKEGVGHYYRVQGPTFLIEFINVQPDAAGNPANHVHSVWRNLSGDFGVTL